MRSTRVILLVHPQDENRVTLQVMLKREGYAVIEAGDVMGALEQIREGVPDLVVMAMRLPRAPGGELIRTIRSDASYPWLKILALGELQSQADAEAAGADTFVVWPGKPERVVSEATRMLGRV